MKINLLNCIYSSLLLFQCKKTAQRSFKNQFRTLVLGYLLFESNEKDNIKVSNAFVMPRKQIPVVPFLPKQILEIVIEGRCTKNKEY